MTGLNFSPRLPAIISAIMLVAAGCAGPGGNVIIDLTAYEPHAASSPPASGTLATVQVAAVEDFRSDLTGGVIGERMTIGNLSMGQIEMEPIPVRVVERLLRGELAALGHGTAGPDTGFTIAVRLMKFDVKTPATALYWDIVGGIELELTVTSRAGVGHGTRYVAECEDRTYSWPSEEIIARVVSDCLSKIAAGFREDAALKAFLSAGS